ncbi:MAG: M48 family metalloprotease [Bacteroidetes bacterium]|nr:M48 family metalloprotease [Bacteroidota bacterium]
MPNFHFPFLRISNLKIIASLIIIFSSFSSNAQQFQTDYFPIRSQGTIPGDFLKSAKDMAEEDINNLGNVEDKGIKKLFVISNNYFLKEYLLSGDVLINDPLTTYVNLVADELLKEQPELRSQLHIYVTKYPDVNAYAFDKGYVFVNIGMLAQLENEAQLAYILAHEITHIVKKHSINQYVENAKLEKGTSSYNKGNYVERNIAKYSFSKEQESEADMEGLQMVKNSKYSISVLNGAFDVLQYSYLPFELVDFKKTFFEDQYLVYPDSFFLKKTSEIKSNDDYDDTKSTHPNIRKRRGKLETELAVEDESSRKRYIVSETNFKNAQEIARFELCKLYLVKRDYINAIYASYLLLEKYPENKFLKKTISQGLFNILVNKTSIKHPANDIKISSELITTSKKYSIPDYKKIEGPSQQLYYFLDKIDNKGLNILALSYIYKTSKQFPNDLQLSNMTDSLFSFLVNTNKLYINDFSKKTKAELKSMDTIKIVEDTVKVEESKYSKIKKQQKKIEVETDDNYFKYGLIGLLQDPDFVSRYTKMAKGLSQKPLVSKDLNKQTVVNNKKEPEPNERFLGISNVIFLEPLYMKLK